MYTTLPAYICVIILSLISTAECSLGFPEIEVNTDSFVHPSPGYIACNSTPRANITKWMGSSVVIELNFERALPEFHQQTEYVAFTIRKNARRSVTDGTWSFFDADHTRFNSSVLGDVLSFSPPCFPTPNNQSVLFDPGWRLGTSDMSECLGEHWKSVHVSASATCAKYKIVSKPYEWLDWLGISATEGVPNEEAGGTVVRREGYGYVFMLPVFAIRFSLDDSQDIVTEAIESRLIWRTNDPPSPPPPAPPPPAYPPPPPGPTQEHSDVVFGIAIGSGAIASVFVLAPLISRAIGGIFT